MLTEDELLKTISTRTKVPLNDIIAKVDAKELEFSGMISRMGAAYIIGNELGVDLVKPVNKDLKINSIVPNMQKVNFLGKIVFLSPVRTFETTDGKGKVLNVILGDETGTIKLSLWNEKTDILDELNVDDVIEVIDGYTKKDYRGMTEVRLSKSRYSNLRKMKDVDISVIESQPEEYEGYKDIRLDSASEDEFVHVKAYLVRIFERNMVKNICPICKSKVEDGRCDKHGSVNSEKFLVASGVIDDGYGNMNVVFFRDYAEFVLNLSAEDVEKQIQSKGEKNFFDSLDVLGDYLNIRGVVRLNKVTDSLELICRDVKKINTIHEINSILNKMKRVCAT